MQKKMPHFLPHRRGIPGHSKGCGQCGLRTAAVGLVQIGPLRVANCAPSNRRKPEKAEVSQKPKLKPPQSTFTIIQMQKVGTERNRGACLISGKHILLIARRKTEVIRKANQGKRMPECEMRNAKCEMPNYGLIRNTSTSSLEINNFRWLNSVHFTWTECPSSWANNTGAGAQNKRNGNANVGLD